MNVKTTFALVSAAAVILACVLGCKMLGSESAGANRNGQQDTATAQTPAPLQNSEVNAATTLPSPTPAPPPNAVCPDPAKPCQNKTIGFDEWSISFKLPAKVQPNKTYRSAQFYAIIVKTLQSGDEDLCDGGDYVESLEQERKILQGEHPERKVFASYECPNMGATEYEFPGSYDKKNQRSLVDNFIAVYAGPTKEDAEKLLPRLKARYPDAAIKPMTAAAEWIDQ